VKYQEVLSTFVSRARFAHKRTLQMIAAVLCFGIVLVPSLHAQQPVFVNTAFGGFILGYDIDQNGTEGILAEALTLQDGKHTVALETFDQKTGKIIRVLKKLEDSNNDFVAWGVYGPGSALVEMEKSDGIFVTQRLYATMNPLAGNVINGKWNPPMTKNDLIAGIAGVQGTNVTAVLKSSLQSFKSAVFSTDVPANTFGEVFPLSDPIFGFNTSPVLSVDSVANQAIVAASNGGIFDSPQIAKVDLATGETGQWTGWGFGTVNGLAVDSAHHLGFTATEIDFSMVVFDITNQFNILVQPLQGATNQSQAGGAVAFDPIHGLVLIGQEFSSIAPSGSSIHVYDTHGNFIKGINGLSLPASPAYMALNPSKRIGFVIVTPNLNQLVQFRY